MFVKEAGRASLPLGVELGEEQFQELMKRGSPGRDNFNGIEKRRQPQISRVSVSVGRWTFGRSEAVGGSAEK